MHNPPQIQPPQILKGQKAIVTGASSGIGLGVAIALAKAGADVVINYRKEKPDDLLKEIESYGVKTYAHQADVSKEEEVVQMFDVMAKKWGRIDILVNNAGLQADSPFEKMTLEQWNRVIGVNLTGQFLCAREAVKQFLKQGVDSNISCAAGKIICMSSVHQVIPWATHANYAASKGGIHLMMESIAQEMAGKHIRVNSIGPGAIRTPINKSAWETKEAYDHLMKLIPYQRIGEPIDIGHAAVWLASDLSDYINGTTIFVDGGMTLYPGFRTGG